MPKLIYIVEDDQDISFIVEYILIEEGYLVNTFKTARAFNTQMKLNWPDLILLDVMLPDGNGIEICHSLKTAATTTHIPVVIMSAHAAETAILEEACADDFISKPFDLEHLIQIIKNTLSKVTSSGDSRQ
ncbi:response regulator transcription factor [Pedobacter frigoris]|uniref:Response regulator n=1 Tax=Pedobacter frigoris TaxID=2571272 RepID=A0A4U1CTT0_9SPHI|nr:response regulator [Pedobacter frigoris]TKC09379.1 response regulator [Pedobacter frigoris]